MPQSTVLMGSRPAFSGLMPNLTLDASASMPTFVTNKRRWLAPGESPVGKIPATRWRKRNA